MSERMSLSPREPTTPDPFVPERPERRRRRSNGDLQPSDVVAAARRLHDTIGCHYGDFSKIDSEYGAEVYEAAKAFIATYETTT